MYQVEDYFGRSPDRRHGVFAGVCRFAVSVLDAAVVAEIVKISPGSLPLFIQTGNFKALGNDCPAFWIEFSTVWRHNPAAVLVYLPDVPFSGLQHVFVPEIKHQHAYSG